MRARPTGGNYEIVGHLATGGMAELFLARARGGAGPYVVLKRILPAQARRSELVSMFLDEARLSARLHHPNIARVLDVGRAGHAYFYTMEYVHGRNLREVLERLVELDRWLPIDAALAILIGAAAGLHAAHEQRDHHGRSLEVVHRDVSPSNVMVGFDGAVKIVDFGVASAVDHVSETHAGVVKGKTGYLSPEQCKLSPLDRRCDVFALGIVAYELLTRTRLFRRGSEYETMHAIVHEHPLPPSRRRRELPPGVDEVVMRALCKDRADRQATAAQLQADLETLARRLGVSTAPSMLAAAMHTLFGTCPEPWQDLEPDSATAHVRLSAFDRLYAEDEPTDPDADAIDLAMAAMRPSATVSVVDELEPTERTPGPLLPLSSDDDVRPTARRPAASVPPPYQPLAVGTLRPGQRSPLAPHRQAGFPSISPTTLTSMVPPPPVRDEIAIVVAPPLPLELREHSQPEIEIIYPPQPQPVALPVHRRAIAILVGAAIGGAAIAAAFAIATC